MKLINIGFGNMVCTERMLAILGPDSAPIKRMIQEARERGMLIDATYGRRTQGVLVMDNDYLVLSALSPELLHHRLEGREKAGEEEVECEKRQGDS